MKNGLNYIAVCNIINLSNLGFDKGTKVMYNSIKSEKDIKNFLDNTNSLHDGFIIGVQYVNSGISVKGNEYCFNPEQTKLIIRIMVTSICDTIIEIEFENLIEWQIRDNQCDIVDTAVIFDEHNWVIWADDTYINDDELKKGSYVIAQSMKWRIIK